MTERASRPSNRQVGAPAVPGQRHAVHPEHTLYAHFFYLRAFFHGVDVTGTETVPTNRRGETCGSWRYGSCPQ